MEEGKQRRVATAKRIEEYRATAPDLTNQKITDIVEALYPNKFFSLDAGTEIIKELYRESEELTEANFKKTLSSLTEQRKLLKFDKEYQKSSELAQKKIALIEKIYTDASVREVHLSQYPEFDDELREYFDGLYADTDKTLAQKFYALFCNYQPTGHLPFHTYSEPNGDIVFTKKEKDISSYPIEDRERNIEKKLSQYVKSTVFIGASNTRKEYVHIDVKSLDFEQRTARVKRLEAILASKNYDSALIFEKTLADGDFSEINEIVERERKSSSRIKGNNSGCLGVVLIASLVFVIAMVI